MGNKEDPAQIVTGYEYGLANSRWNHFWLDEINDVPLAFHNYLGLTKGFRKVKNPNGKIHIRGSAARKIKMLNSENWKVLLKVYKHKYNLERFK